MSPVKEAPKDLRGILRQLGPGLIISANIVGSGELIVTTKLGADIGFMLLWFIIFGCMIKVFLQVELGRYASFGNLKIRDAEVKQTPASVANESFCWIKNMEQRNCCVQVISILF